MRIISRNALIEFWQRHPDARIPMEAWYRVVKSTSFANFNDMRRAFNSADYVAPYTVFDVGGNNFRVIAAIHYNGQRLYIRFVFTHAEYDNWNKKHRSKKK
jgi:mRNA interferase HigB